MIGRSIIFAAAFAVPLSGHAASQLMSVCEPAGQVIASLDRAGFQLQHAFALQAGPESRKGGLAIQPVTGKWLMFFLDEGPGGRLLCEVARGDHWQDGPPASGAGS